MDSELFHLSVARRLRLRLLEDFATCPCCGASLDAYMDHALVCICGGDRTLRHHAARDDLAHSSREAGIRAEKEKAGLLPPRPDADTIRGEGSDGSGRRPADVWLPNWDGTAAAAVDLAITSGLRNDAIATAADNPSAIWAQYENFKRQHLNTEAVCSEAGLRFLPFVVEAHGGGFGPAARRVIGGVNSIGATA